MCRLFGFRSVINSQVHSSLLEADNALIKQSMKHPDGWGVAYYQNNIPHIVKSTNSAFECGLFKKISSQVVSQSIIAHIRKATWGNNDSINTHPFQYGHWTFAHNGNIRNFHEHKNKILSLISTPLKRFILGDTDSEVLFYYLLSQISLEHNLADPMINTNHLNQLMARAIGELIQIIGPVSLTEQANTQESYLTFILSSGSIMLGFNGGLNLYYCTHKKECPDRANCQSFASVCERPYLNGESVNHLIFSSEKLIGPNVWNLLPSLHFLSIDQEMKVLLTKL